MRPLGERFNVTKNWMAVSIFNRKSFNVNFNVHLNAINVNCQMDPQASINGETMKGHLKLDTLVGWFNIDASMSMVKCQYRLLMSVG